VSGRPRIAGSKRTLAVLAAVAIAIAALVLVACGGGGSSSGSSAAASGPDPVTGEGVTEIATAAFPTGRDTDEVSATGAKPIPPCWLVPKKQAEGILGKGVSVTERPLGPTCVYNGSGREVDVVIEKVPLGSLKASAKSADPVTIAGRSGYCLRSAGSTSVALDVGQARVLQITGACQAAVRFAAVAIPRVARAT
jgi:hypothetical protein